MLNKKQIENFATGLKESLTQPAADNAYVLVKVGVLESILQSLSEIQSQLAKEKPSNPGRLLNSKEVCALLGISSRTLQNWRDENKINFIPLSTKKILYDPSEIKKIIKYDK